MLAWLNMPWKHHQFCSVYVWATGLMAKWSVDCAGHKPLIFFSLHWVMSHKMQEGLLFTAVNIFFKFPEGTNKGSLGFWYRGKFVLWMCTASVPLTPPRPRWAHSQNWFLCYIYKISSVLKDHNWSFMILFPIFSAPFSFASLPFQACIFY